MFSSNKWDLINTEIVKFYTANKVDDLNNVPSLFHANGGFSASKIVDYVWPNLRTDQVLKDLVNYKYEDYLQCYNKLLPILHYTDKILKEKHKIIPNGLKMEWMGDNFSIYLNMEVNYNNPQTLSFEHILVLTSLLENALANVYLSQTKANHVPHLLKDLLNTTEIIDAVGLDMVILLKILMGSPNSINLRNIVWHGFPKPGQVPAYYVNVLLIAIHTIGCVIESKSIKLNNRNQIKSYNQQIKIFETQFQSLPINLSSIKEKLQELKIGFNLYWLQLVNYYETEKYKEFLILALPQIELLLRLHYGSINNYDISAKLDEYYITVDTIFNHHLPIGGVESDIPNKLLNLKNSNLEGCFHLLYDLFLSPNGCRLRDKVSHGEVYLEALNNSQLCSLVFYIFLVLTFPEEIKVFENYESKLHLNSITKSNLMKALVKIKLFYSNHLKNERYLYLNELRFDNKILIFKRPKKEAEFMLLINKIAENIHKTVLNYEESLNIRFSMLAQRELHSKRRKTLEKLQNALPIIFQAITSITLCSFKIFKMLQNGLSDILDNAISDKTLRFLKRCLTISENFLKYSYFESSEWIKSVELCRKYDEFYEKLFWL